MSASVFISYSRRDGSEFARDIRTKLEAAGLKIWQDIVQLEGGIDWWTQIENVLRSPELKHLVLVVSPEALDRPVIRQEIRLARALGKQVTPIRTKDLQSANIPRWMGHVLDPSVKEHWNKLVETLKGASRQQHVPSMAPSPSATMIGRSELISHIKQALLRKNGDALHAVVALVGAGGIGKTTLAQAIAHDDDIMDAYFDGVLWAHVGQQAEDKRAASIHDIIVAITGQKPNSSTSDGLRKEFVEALGDRRYLLVLDDVWNSADLEPFLSGGPQTSRLITSRLSGQLKGVTESVSIGSMSDLESLAMLARNLPVDQIKRSGNRLAQLKSHLDGAPLLLDLANAFLFERVTRHGQSIEASVEDALKRYGAGGTFAFVLSSDRRGDGARTVTSVFNTTLSLLDDRSRRRSLELGALADDLDIPIRPVIELWRQLDGQSEIESEDLLQHFSRISLLSRLDFDKQLLRIHSVVHDQLADQLSKEEHARIHGALGRIGTQFIRQSPSQTKGREFELKYWTAGGRWTNNLLTHLVLGSQWEIILDAIRDPDWARIFTPYEFFGSSGWSSALNYTDGAIRNIAQRFPESVRPALYKAAEEGCAATARKFYPLLNAHHARRSVPDREEIKDGYDWQTVRDGAFEFVSVCMRLADLVRLARGNNVSPAECYRDISTALFSIPGYHAQFTMRLSDVAEDVYADWHREGAA